MAISRDERKRTRLISKEALSKEQALWICKAVLTHYRTDGRREEDQRDFLNIISRVSKTSNIRRGNNWSSQAIGYNLEETWYGTETSGIYEAWATLVALGISRQVNSPHDHRFYKAFGLHEGYDFKVSVCHVTEVYAISNDVHFHKYVKDCLAQLVNDCRDFPEAFSVPDPLFSHKGKKIQDV